MELFKSLKDKTKLYEAPFKHYELNEPLTSKAIKEVCEAKPYGIKTFLDLPMITATMGSYSVFD